MGVRAVESIQRNWGLHLHSGVAVVDLEGGWDEDTDQRLTDVITRLIGSGHLDIIVNLTRATGLTVSETCWLEGLERLAAMTRAHRGRLNVVGTINLLEVGLRRQARSLLGWVTSEEEALCHLNGLPMATGGQKLSTRLA
jgi:hypothetical protein